MFRSIGFALLVGVLGACGGGFRSGSDGAGTGDGFTGQRDGGPGGPKAPVCPGQEVTITGTVLAPNGQDPVPGATVFVPSQLPELFPPDVRCEVCGSLGQTSNFWTTTSNPDGTFVLNGVCPGGHPLVLQNGRFRRFLRVTVSANQTLALPPSDTRLPRRTGEFDPIDAAPKIAVATGDYDKMECVLRNIGLDDSQFDLYEGAEFLTEPFSNIPTFESLVGDPTLMKQYNIIFINCTNNTFEDALMNPTTRQNIKDYVNSGGRLYVTDWSYDWIEQIGDFAPFIDFEPGVSAAAPEAQNAAAIGEGGIEVDATIVDANLKQWLGLFPGAIAAGLTHIEHFLAQWVMMHQVGNETKVWVEANVSGSGVQPATRPLTVTFNFQNCGKILFSSYHTEGRDDEVVFGVPNPIPYPDRCGSQLSPQNRILEYLIFDIANCIKPIE